MKRKYGKSNDSVDPKVDYKHKAEAWKKCLDNWIKFCHDMAEERMDIEQGRDLELSTPICHRTAHIFGW